MEIFFKNYFVLSWFFNVFIYFTIICIYITIFKKYVGYYGTLMAQWLEQCTIIIQAVGSFEIYFIPLFVLGITNVDLKKLTTK